MRMAEGQAVVRIPLLHVGIVGNHFLPGVEDALQAACAYASAHNVNVIAKVVNDVCVLPYHGVGAMRNLAFLEGLAERADYIMLLDTDIILTEDALVRLVEARRHIIVPWFTQDAFTDGQHMHRVQWPLPEPRQGVVPLDWCCTSCILFDAVALRALPSPRLFCDPLITNEETYLFAFLGLYGLKLWQDTDCVVKMLRPPTQLWTLFNKPNPNPETAHGTSAVPV